LAIVPKTIEVVKISFPQVLFNLNKLISLRNKMYKSYYGFATRQLIGFDFMKSINSK